MGIRKYWVLECDAESQHDPHRHMEITLPCRLFNKQDAFEAAAQWAVIPVIIGSVEVAQLWICPSCRIAARKQQNPLKFTYPVPTPIVDTPERPVPKPIICLYEFPCGHQFANTLNPAPSANGTDGQWECTACVQEWLNSGNVDEVPLRIKGRIEKIKAKYKAE